MKRTISTSLMRAMVTTVILGLPFFASVARADDPVAVPMDAVHGDVMARTFPDDVTVKQIVIRGDVAQYLYDSFTAGLPATIERRDGTTFLVRYANGMSCARSDIFATAHFACVSFYDADGTAVVGYLDPEYGGVARIGVGN
jgi:hypothetical protein